MATADTINSIRTHLENDYEGLENLGVTAEDRNIENIRTCLDELYNNIPKTTDTGTNLSLNTLKGKMNIIPKGDTEQDTYNGYNKMNTANATIGYKPEGTTITFDSKGVINANTDIGYASINLPSITLSSGTTYTFKRNFTGSYNSSLVDTNGETIVAIGYNKTSVTLTPESDITINKLNGALVSGDNYFWLYEGTTDKSFEPFVGGTASPNPTYPQNIEVVTGTQEVKVENKNLLPTPYVYDSRTINGITFTINNDYSISVSGTATGNATFVLFNQTSTEFEKIRNILLNNTCSLSGCPSGGSSSSYRLQLYGKGSQSTGTSVDYGSGVSISDFVNISGNFNIAIFIPSGVAITTPILFKPQLEIGNATTYTPHQEQTQIVSLGDIELCKIGNYQDYLYKSSDKWYKKKYIGKHILSTSDTWTLNRSSNNLYQYRTKNDLLEDVITSPDPYSRAVALCNYYAKGDINGMTTQCFNIGGLKYIGITSDISTLANFNTFITNNSIYVYYVCQTPQDIEITNTTLIEQLNNLEKMKSYNGVTNISSSGNLPIVLSVSALKGE